MARLEGQTAVITGAAGGIGSAAVRAFVKEGANVLAVDIDEEKLNQLLDDLGDDRVSSYLVDVTQASENLTMADVAVERYGGINHFLANAGIEGQVQPILSYDESTFDRVIAVNVKGVWLGLRAVVPKMIESGGGSVVITSSVAGLRGGPNVAPYSTSKHAVIGLMRSAAKEFAPYNIRVNTINPSPVETRMMRSLEAGSSPDDPDLAKRRIAANIPLGRYAEPSEIASVMLFLCTSDASWITGSVYTVDGGNTA